MAGLQVACGNLTDNEIKIVFREILVEVLNSYKKEAHRLINAHAPKHTGRRSKASIRYGTIRDRLHESVDRSTINSYVLNGEKAFYIKFVDKTNPHLNFFNSKIHRPLRKFVYDRFRLLMQERGLDVK